MTGDVDFDVGQRPNEPVVASEPEEATAFLSADASTEARFQRMGDSLDKYVEALHRS